MISIPMGALRPHATNSSTAHMGSLTVMIAATAGDILAKTIKLSPTSGFEIVAFKDAYYYDAEVIPYRDQAELCQIIGDLQTMPGCALVWGELTPHAQAMIGKGYNIRRTIYDRVNCPATLRDRASTRLVIDADKHPLINQTRLVTDPESVVREVVLTLPACFHERTVVWAASATCGFRPRVAKFHLHFESDTPVTGAEFKDWWSDCKVIDAAIYTANQLEYTANAVLGEGVVDPMPRRHGIIRYPTNLVTLGPSPFQQTPSVPAKTVGAGKQATPANLRPWQQKLLAAASNRSKDAVANALGLLGDGEGCIGFHAALRRAAFIYSMRVREGAEPRDDAGLVALMQLTIDGAECADGRAEERKDQKYLQSLINSAFQVKG